jgi:hypothetical protein
MATKAYDAQQALNPGMGEQPAEGGQSSEEVFKKLYEDLPPEFRDEVVEALAALLNYIHSDEGTTEIIDSIQQAKGKEAEQVGIAALQAMDAADPEHKWRDPTKVMCGYMAISEVATIAREAGLVDIPQEQEAEIFQQAAQNYLHAIIKNKPTPEERDAEAIRIQKEVEPLMTDKMRAIGTDAAKKHGVPHESSQPAQPQAVPQQAGGLLE